MREEQKHNGTDSAMMKLATFIVDKRNLVFLITIIALIFSAFSQSWVEVENTLAETIDAEVSVIMVYVAMILNAGSNFLLGTISFVSNSVTSILQLALSLDYAVILCNRFKEEHRTLPLREAVIVALSKGIPEIGASSLTTIGGLLAMMFMQFKIGQDSLPCFFLHL